MAIMAKSTPKVSVIVPNYNHARFLHQRIDTILAQTFQDFELVLLDDCSTDGSRSILSSYASDPRVRLEFNEKNSGSTFKQWNKGVRLALGEYVWIAESDDRADEKFLGRLVAVLDRDSRVALVNCRSWRVDADDRLEGYADFDLETVDPQKWTKDFNADGYEECCNYFVRFCPVYNASSALFRKSVYDQVGGADENLRFCGDWKLWAAMALTGRVAHVSDPLNYYRAHGANTTEESKLMGLAAMEYLHVIRWILGRVTPTEATLKTLRDAISKIWIPAMTYGHVPLARRYRILRDAMAIDPGALRRLRSPMLAAIRIKFCQRCQLFWESSRRA